MKPTVLLAAALLALSGCYSRSNYSSNYGDVTFYWKFVDGGGGVHGNYLPGSTGCGDVVVDSVTVTFQGHTYSAVDAAGNASCVGPNGVPGLTVTNFLAGRYPFTVQGYRGNELVYQDGDTVDVVGGVNTQKDTSLAALSPQSIPLYFTLNGVQSCAGISGLNYAIADSSGAVVDFSQNPIPCDAASFGFLAAALPLGNYTLTHLQALSNGFSAFEVCDQPLSHTGVAHDFNLLPPVGGGCPR